ncbi:ABC transporter permease [Paenibacillus koleovorans]|uniref:ABC transporter permease n=1 Tax=Paenibacillus koleovorans TaxID=121608 RepID=UPI001FE510B7|nr:ABC transporter permease subunit [Paenibacillus koleovorans]
MTHKFRKVLRNYDLYLILLPTIVYFLIFEYWPMYGVQIAFKNFLAMKGIWGSPWVGFDNFLRFFHSFYFWQLIRNTLLINVYVLIFAFPVPILLALLLNQLPSLRFKRFVQTVTYAPHFISVVVLVGVLSLLLSPNHGPVNNLIQLFGSKPIFFMADPSWFRTVYIASGIWQTAGWSAIIYLAALTSINPELHESAVMDGANKFRRILHIDLPGIMPTVTILLILNIGSFMTVGFEKVYLMQNPLNISAAEVIQTHVYKTGLLQGKYSFATAIGLFNSVINLILLVSINKILKRMGKSSLW